MNVKKSIHRWKRERRAEGEGGTTEGRGKARTRGVLGVSFPSTDKFFKSDAVICIIGK